MKYNLKDHPYLFMMLGCLLLLAISLYLGYLYHWSVYSIIAISISGLGTFILFVIFLKDYLSFRKKNKKDE